MGGERVGIGFHEAAAFIIIGVEKKHVVAKADEEPVGVVASEDCLVDVVEHDVGYKQREGTALRHATRFDVGARGSELCWPAELVGVLTSGVMEPTSDLPIDMAVALCLKPSAFVVVVAGQIGIEHSHDLRLTFG